VGTILQIILWVSLSGRFIPDLALGIGSSSSLCAFLPSRILSLIGLAVVLNLPVRDFRGGLSVLPEFG
jgi:hypothetical protein